MPYPVPPHVFPVMEHIIIIGTLLHCDFGKKNIVPSAMRWGVSRTNHLQALLRFRV